MHLGYKSPLKKTGQLREGDIWVNLKILVPCPVLDDKNSSFCYTFSFFTSWGESHIDANGTLQPLDFSVKMAAFGVF